MITFKELINIPPRWKIRRISSRTTSLPSGSPRDRAFNMTKVWRWPSTGHSQGVAAEEVAAAEGAEAVEDEDQHPNRKEVGRMPMELKGREQTGTRLLEPNPDVSTHQENTGALIVALTTTGHRNALTLPMNNKLSCI